MKMYTFKTQWAIRREICDTLAAYDRDIVIEHSVDPRPGGRFFVRTGAGIEFEGADCHKVYSQVIEHFREIRDLTNRLIN